MAIHIAESPDEWSHTLAGWITDYIVLILSNRDRFTLALSGGNTPKVLYQLLASSPYREKIDWSRMHLFCGDERDVPFSDDRSNAKMVFDTLLSRVTVPAAQIHMIRTDLDPQDAALQYESILHGYFPAVESPASWATFDLVLLGMGEDGHTLSLFPGTAVLNEQQLWVSAFYLDAQQMYRVTLTRAVVNLASRIAFLATGSGKAQTLKAVLQGPYLPERYPSQLIQPVHGELHWFVDRAAASAL